MSFDINPLLDTIADFLHFITEFFDVIKQSGPHIYHSTLLLAPKSSIAQRLYNQMIYSQVGRAVTGVPALWGSCTASVQVTIKDWGWCAIWSPSGQFIAVTSGQQVEV